MFQGAYVKDVDRAGFIANYNTFQNLMAEHGLTLLTTFYGLSTTSCSNATDFINLIVAAEKKGVGYGENDLTYTLLQPIRN